jgi:hypothetical protein
MEIIVLGVKIDTKEITSIIDIEENKKMFFNREAGFVITFMDGSSKIFKENIPYESYTSEICNIKDKWSRLQKEITEKWDKDKHDLQEFGFSVKAVL